MLETPFQSNGLLSGTEMEKSDEPMTAREELEMMSNGILDGSMEDAEVMRTLSASGETGAADVNGKKMTKDGEARNAPSRDVQEEFSGNGLLFGGMADIEQQSETTRPEENVDTTVAIPATTPDESASTITEFQGNGILGGDLPMMDEPMREEGSQVPMAAVEDVPVEPGFETNGLLGDFEQPPAVSSNPSLPIKSVSETAATIPNGTTNGNTELGASSLDQLLDELDSAGYTAAEKGKGRADATRRVPALTTTTTRSALPILGEPETPTDGESLFPGMNLVLLTDEAEKLMPLEAVDGKGRKVVFKRKPRKVVDGKGVSRPPIIHRREKADDC